MIYASYANGSIAGYAFSDSHGKFIIDELSPGTYSVSAEVPGYFTVNNVQASPSYDMSNTANYGKAVGADVSLNIQTITAVEPGKTAVPAKFSLAQNFPNPFNPATRINFTVPARAKVSLRVFSLIGQEVMTLVNGTYDAGTYSVDFNGSRLASGIYFYTLQAGSFNSTRKMILLK